MVCCHVGNVILLWEETRPCNLDRTLMSLESPDQHCQLERGIYRHCRGICPATSFILHGNWNCMAVYCLKLQNKPDIRVSTVLIGLHHLKLVWYILYATLNVTNIVNIYILPHMIACKNCISTIKRLFIVSSYFLHGISQELNSAHGPRFYFVVLKLSVLSISFMITTLAPGLAIALVSVQQPWRISVKSRESTVAPFINMV